MLHPPSPWDQPVLLGSEKEVVFGAIRSPLVAHWTSPLGIDADCARRFRATLPRLYLSLLVTLHFHRTGPAQTNVGNWGFRNRCGQGLLPTLLDGRAWIYWLSSHAPHASQSTASKICAVAWKSPFIANSTPLAIQKAPLWIG